MSNTIRERQLALLRDYLEQAEKGPVREEVMDEKEPHNGWVMPDGIQATKKKQVVPAWKDWL